MTDSALASVTRRPRTQNGDITHRERETGMKLNIFDSHVHTNHSFDAQDSAEDICAQALERGVMGIAFTDHYECDRVEKLRCGEIEKTYEELPGLQEKYWGRLRITKGIELGQPDQDPGEADRILSRHPDLDLVLGSVHVGMPLTDVSEMNFNDPAVRVSDILQYYFQACYDLAVWGKFDVMAHLGYPERYIWGRYRIPVDFTPYEDLIHATLKLLVDGGKGLEVNTSGYRQGLGKTIPVLRIIREYYQLGGRIVTLGSDAHRAGDVAADFEVAMDILTGVGFRYFAFYRERQPVMLELM